MGIFLEAYPSLSDGKKNYLLLDESDPIVCWIMGEKPWTAFARITKAIQHHAQSPEFIVKPSRYYLAILAIFITPV